MVLVMSQFRSDFLLPPRPMAKEALLSPLAIRLFADSDFLGNRNWRDFSVALRNYRQI